ncbi:MAG: DUF411 domain-containing protein [Burkholderiaceae bacterium]|nr:DUF411 domain-containing protein [Burkholderiaceae bacterium]
MATTSTDPHRRGWLLGATGLVLAGVLPGLGFAHGTAARLEMWSNDGCACCDQWAKHLQSYQFDVTQRQIDDVSVMRTQLGMPEKYAGCHVARVGRYAIDGHVPAIDILKLLREQPQAIGLAVPDMPMGSPGMERGNHRDPFQVWLVAFDGNATVFKSYP